jgi:hypothetical protein
MLASDTPIVVYTATASAARREKQICQQRREPAAGKRREKPR